ncbi:MAG: hypothetical protein AAFR04_12985 [Pseudomonadota bacterium]
MLKPIGHTAGIAAAAVAAAVAFTILATTAHPAAANISSKRLERVASNMAFHARLIEQGRFRGDLTRREYRALKRQQRDIARMRRQALRDGWLAYNEYSEIKRAQHAAYANIRAERSDRAVSYVRRFLWRIRG